MNEEITQEMVELLKKSGSEVKSVALEAQNKIAKSIQKSMAAAISPVIRQGSIVGDTILELFNRTKFDPNARVEYPIDFYRNDNANEFTAYVVPNQGRIPQRQVEGDYITVPTFDVANSIDFLIRYAKEARWDIVSRALEVLEAGFVKKMNDDSWHVILAAGFDRNIIVSDANASAGQFSKRLVSLAKLVMRRNSGGNSTSLNRGRLTHLFVSPEAIEDMRNWGLDEVDDVTRRDIYVMDDNAAVSVFGVKIVPLDELGENQEYQRYYTEVVAAGAANSGMASGDLEIAIGIDATTNDSFVMPIRDELQVFEDEYLHRENRMGFYARTSYGVAVLNNSRTLLLSL